jgi:hypothetical protein
VQVVEIKAPLGAEDGTCVDGVQEPKECPWEDGICDVPTHCPDGTDLVDCGHCFDGTDLADCEYDTVSHSGVCRVCEYDTPELRAARTGAPTPEGEFEPTGLAHTLRDLASLLDENP